MFIRTKIKKIINIYENVDLLLIKQIVELIESATLTYKEKENIKYLSNMAKNTYDYLINEVEKYNFTFPEKNILELKEICEKEYNIIYNKINEILYILKELYNTFDYHLKMLSQIFEIKSKYKYKERYGIEFNIADLFLKWDEEYKRIIKELEN